MDGLTAGRIGVRWGEQRGAVERSYRTILQSVLGHDLTPGTKETPARAAKAWAELTSGYDADIAGLFKVFDEDGYDEMIGVANIPFASLCEHHLLPFVGAAHVVYIPQGGRVIGLSKIPRLVDAFAQRLQVQERLTAQVADALDEHLAPLGTLVVIDATHSCAALRGVKKPGMTMRTAVARGAIRDTPEARAEAYALIGALK